MPCDSVEDRDDEYEREQEHEQDEKRE